MAKFSNEEDMNFIYSLHANANEQPSSRAKIVFILIASFFTVFLVWMAYAEIDELARGNGKVIPTDKIQKIQSLDGGLISEILVKEGQLVKIGDKLMKIDTTRFQASLEENRQEYFSLLAIKTRLEAEGSFDLKNKNIKLDFPKEILHSDNRDYKEAEENLYKNRITEFKANLRVLDNQKGQKKLEIREIDSTIKKLKKSLIIIKKQRTTIKKLVRAKIKSQYDLLNIEKEYNQATGDLDVAKYSKPRAQLAFEETENRIIEKIQNFRSEASDNLQKTISLIKKFEAKLVSDEDKVAKTIVMSPVDGIIKQININTIGGVVRSGMDLIEIVPLSDVLVVEAKIDPKDIAFINPKQKAIVKITAYDFSIYGGLDATIVEISADSIIDKESKDQKSYYRVLVKTNKNYLERNGEKLPIIPGMIASVDIITGKKTILDFILKPILKTKNNAFHER